MATVSTIRLSVDLLDCAFVDSLDPRFLYRDSPYQIALTVLNGEAGLSTGIKIYDEDGEYLDLAGTATAADGTATITIDDEINFDGVYTCLICVNGSKSAEFPLEVRAIGSPVPPTGTVLDWNAITSYTDTATKGPVRAGTGITNTVNLDGSNTHSVAYGTTAGTAAQGNDSRLSDSRTPTGAAGGVLSGNYPNPGFAVDMATQGELDAHTGATVGAHAATAISNTPAGGIAATTVQAAINELDSEKLSTTAQAADVNPAGTAIAAALLAKLNANDASVTNAREWTADTVAQAEAEAGTATTRRAWTAQRVRQAIAAWWVTITDVVKTSGNQTIAGQKTFSDVLTGPTIISGVGTTGTGTLIGNRGFNTANGEYAVAEGDATTASGRAGHAEGVGTVASGTGSHAEGLSSIASGDGSHAEGDETTASGRASHAGGAESLASGQISYARGRKPQAIHDGASVETDNQDAVLASTAENQCTWRFLNGYRFFGGALYIDALTASRPLWLDASKNVTSPAVATVRADIGAAALTPTVNAQVGTTYTLAAADAGAIVTATNGSAITVTIPPNSSIPLAVGTIVNIVQGGAGIVTIEGGTGVTVNGVSGGTGAITARWQGVALLKVATDTWIGSGSIGTVA